MRKISQIGLGPQYVGDDATYEILSQIMSLCYIPARFIRPRFEKLAELCITTKLKEFAEYMRSTWIENQFIPPEMWSVFGCETRTNNALEGKLF